MEKIRKYEWFFYFQKYAKSRFLSSLENINFLEYSVEEAQDFLILTIAKQAIDLKNVTENTYTSTGLIDQQLYDIGANLNIPELSPESELNLPFAVLLYILESDHHHNYF